MKYLKCFEDTKLYQSVEGDIGKSLRRIEPSEDVLNLLNQYISKYFREEFQKFNGIWEDRSSIYIRFNIGHVQYDIYVFEYEDDWFLVSVQSRYRMYGRGTKILNFKCDTAEGITQLLDDLIGQKRTF